MCAILDRIYSHYLGLSPLQPPMSSPGGSVPDEVRWTVPAWPGRAHGVEPLGRPDRRARPRGRLRPSAHGPVAGRGADDGWPVRRGPVLPGGGEAERGPIRAHDLLDGRDRRARRQPGVAGGDSAAPERALSPA